MKDTKVTTQVDFYESFLYYTIKQKPIQKFLFLFFCGEKKEEKPRKHIGMLLFFQSYVMILTETIYAGIAQW